MCKCLSKISTSSNKSTTYTKSTSTQKTEPISVCGYMYNELLQLGLLVLKILKETKDEIIKETNDQILVWIRNLDKECPDEYELNVIKEYIEHEYPEYIT